VSELNNATSKLMELIVSNVLKKHNVKPSLKQASDSERALIKETVESLKLQVTELLEKNAVVTTDSNDKGTTE
jgi:hypothetical protein